MPDWIDDLLGPGNSSLEQRRAAQISERMDRIGGREPLFVAEPNDPWGGTQEENAAYRQAEAADTEQMRAAQKAQEAEEARLQRFDRRHADPSHWDGRVNPDGSIEFRDWRAREADTENGRRLRKKLAEELMKRAPRKG